jgi:hypothetical protein
MLISVVNRLLQSFDALTGGMAELEPDVFGVLSGNVYTTHENYLHRIDLRGWIPGEPVKPSGFSPFRGECLAQTVAARSRRCLPPIFLGGPRLPHLASGDPD